LIFEAAEERQEVRRSGGQEKFLEEEKREAPDLLIF
jgi:hypothetical protein